MERPSAGFSGSKIPWGGKLIERGGVFWKGGEFLVSRWEDWSYNYFQVFFKTCDWNSGGLQCRWPRSQLTPIANKGWQSAWPQIRMPRTALSAMLTSATNRLCRHTQVELHLPAPDTGAGWCGLDIPNFRIARDPGAIRSPLAKGR